MSRVLWRGQLGGRFALSEWFLIAFVVVVPNTNIVVAKNKNSKTAIMPYFIHRTQIKRCGDHGRNVRGKVEYVTPPYSNFH